MNTAYLLITFYFLIYAILQLVFGALSSGHEVRSISVVVSGIIGVVMLLLSVAAPTGFKKTDYFEATNTRIGDEFVIQSVKKEFETMYVTDVKYEDKEVVVKRTCDFNAWGEIHIPTVKFEVKVVDKAEKP